MKRIAHKTALHCAGWSCILFGILAGFLPLIPGFVFVIVGIYLLGQASLWLWNHIERLKIKFPRFAFQYMRIDTKISKYIKRAH
ncbi:hypothetical protein KW782_00085 [Candidatus Parcubacteria bacterium]|nr:hypothetical protein [Candidatus Parcubacteria bacterium]